MTYKVARCTSSEFPRVLEIINSAAHAYDGVIPDTCFKDPYMPASELTGEITSGVDFFGCYDDDHLIGVMGIQNVKDVTLIRHAYVDPNAQRFGSGTMLLEHLRSQTDKPILIGTWKAATWAIAFYNKHGFSLVDCEAIRPLLEFYWTVPDTQVSNSCVLVETEQLARFSTG